MVFGEYRAGPKKRNRERDMSQKDGNWSCLGTVYLIGHANISQPQAQLTYKPAGRKCSVPNQLWVPYFGFNLLIFKIGPRGEGRQQKKSNNSATCGRKTTFTKR